MGQEDVYLLLKKHKKRWLSSREIIDMSKKSSGSVITSLQKLRKSGIVDFKMGKATARLIGRRKVYIYRFKK
jgi:biotin operon repressor